MLFAFNPIDSRINASLLVLLSIGGWRNIIILLYDYWSSEIGVTLFNNQKWGYGFCGRRMPIGTALPSVFFWEPSLPMRSIWYKFLHVLDLNIAPKMDIKLTKWLSSSFITRAKQIIESLLIFKHFIINSINIDLWLIYFIYRLI